MDHYALSWRLPSCHPASGTFDWLYIDALHTKSALLTNLHTWWPKLRVGGLLSGSDYGDEVDTPLVNLERYQLTQQPFSNISSRDHWGVIRATQAFAREVGASLHVSWMKSPGRVELPDSCYHWPAWYLVKPPLIGAGAGDDDDASL